MQKYKVQLYYHTNATVVVYANNEQDAIETARCHVSNEDLLEGIIEDNSPDVTIAADDEPAVNMTPKEHIYSIIKKCGCRRSYGNLLVPSEPINLNENQIEMLRVNREGVILVSITGKFIAEPIDDVLSEAEISRLETELELKYKVIKDFDDNEEEEDDFEGLDEDFEDPDDEPAEPQPLFSEEEIENLKIGTNRLRAGIMYIDNNGDLIKSKDYLRELNRRHLAGEPLMDATVTVD